MLTAIQIANATGDGLTRLGLQVTDAAYEDQKDTNAKFEASLAVQDAELPKQTQALNAQAASAADLVDELQRVANALAAQASLALNKKQQAFFDLYAVHLKARKDPAIITSATSDTIVKDIALDSMMMTQEVWPLFKQAMASMEVPPGGVDWS